LPDVDQPLRHLDGRQHEVDHAGGNGCTGHAVVRGVLGRLRQGDAAALLDAGKAHGTVAAGARHHDADGAFLVHFGHGAEEHVDGNVPTRDALARRHAQMTIVHRERHAGRNDVHVVRLDRHGLADLPYRHARGALEDFGGAALVLGRQMKDHHEGHA
jgi:hypothetical protein